MLLRSILPFRSAHGLYTRKLTRSSQASIGVLSRPTARFAMSTSAPGSPELPPAKRMRSRSPEQTTSEQAASTSAAALTSANASIAQEKQARKADARRSRQKRKDYAKQLTKTGREPIEFDIENLLGVRKVTDILSEGAEYQNKFERGTRLTLRIECLDAHGDGLAVAPGRDWVVAVPHVLPEEKVVVDIVSNERLYSKAKLIEVLKKSDTRQDSLVRCQYFGDCGGCQYQMMDYARQLEIKRGVVERAFSRFSGLEPGLIPDVLPTIPSPSQYNYRTKLTPHFELPYELRRGRRSGIRNNNANGNGASNGDKPEYDVPIGFDCIGTKRVMDIEECPIATTTINRALPAAKQKVRDGIESFKNGATLLLRDSLRTYDSFAEDRLATETAELAVERELDTEVVTDHKATVKERVLTTKFESPAGTFFQNNRSILPSLLEYVREQILQASPEGTSDSERYLVDAYCGSGLFSLCLASLFREVSGVEISSESIKYATKNAELNGITNAKFLAGNAEEIFAKIEYPADQTTVIIDPPRRGCDEEFIRQLVNLGPKHIVYVSCNVHTQARDVGQLVTRDARYKVKSVRGADLFPQTHHVEGVCVLERVDA